MIEEEEFIEVYELTRKGRRIMKKFDKEYLKAWKQGHNERQSLLLALSKVDLT